MGEAPRRKSVPLRRQSAPVDAEEELRQSSPEEREPEDAQATSQRRFCALLLNRRCREDCALPSPRES